VTWRCKSSGALMTGTPSRTATAEQRCAVGRKPQANRREGPNTRSHPPQCVRCTTEMQARGLRRPHGL
jgi:hypothetical protein